MKIFQSSCPLNHAAGNFPDSTAILHGPLSMTYSELDRLVDACAEKFRAAGIVEEERVSLVHPPGPDYIIILWALWRLGAVACPLNTRLPKETLTRQIQSIEADTVFTSEYFPLVKPSLNIRRIPWEDYASLTADTSSPTPAPTDLNWPATIIFTSGSSAAPNAAVHSINHHLANAKGSVKHIPFGPGDRWLLTLPLYHVSGLSLIFRSVLGGGTLVIPPLQEDLTRSVEKYQITHLSVVTTQLNRIFQNPHNLPRLSTLKAILLGGSSVSAHLIATAKQWGLPLFTSYGLTEMASQVATTAPLDQWQGDEPRAQILEHAQVKISDNEILVKGSSCFLGYWQDGKINAPFDEEGWYATGDLGCLDTEGLLTVTGRKDCMFISGGENIQPEEIEREILELEGVEQAVVVPAADKSFGFRPVAFLKEDGSANLTSKNLQKHLRQTLPGYKVPIFFYRWPKHLRPAALKIPRQIFTNLIQEQPHELEEYQ